MKEQNDLDEQTNETQPTQETDFYTLAEIRKLTPDEINHNWDKVARSLKHISREEVE